MKCYRSNMWVMILIMGILTMGLWGCAAMQPKPTAQLEVIPSETLLSPALLKKPIVFKGSGYAPNEMIIVDLMIPKGVKIKSVPEDEEAVGLAFGNADENGNFQAKMGTFATLNWLFQIDWAPNMKPDFKKATPLPSGDFQILATGAESDKFGMATLTLLPPPKKE